MIAKKLAESMATWQTDKRKLLCIITDNGSNMMKAVKSLQHGEGCQSKEELSLVDDDELPDADADVQDDSDMEQVPVMLDSSVEIKRLSCIAHELLHVHFSSWCMHYTSVQHIPMLWKKQKS